MSDFKNNISEEQIAAYLEGKNTMDDLSLLNAMANDIDLIEVIDIVQECDDMIDEINELSGFEEKI